MDNSVRGRCLNSNPVTYAVPPKPTIADITQSQREKFLVVMAAHYSEIMAENIFGRIT